METVTSETWASGSKTRVERVTYGYDASGFRTSALHEIDADAMGGYETSTTTEFLADHASMTGYTQTILETHRDHEQAITKEIEYTFGLDEIAQTVAVGSNASTVMFGHDGHGSVRMLTDVNELIAEAYLYDAYGQMLARFDGTTGTLNVAGGAAPTGGNPRTFADASEAATNLLYSGETFDARIGQQYLRARWYDAATGRFNRLDPFFGDLYDPQSLHRYGYTHADPVSGIDPTGEFIAALGFLARMTGFYARSALVAANVYGFASNTLAALQDISFARHAFSRGQIGRGIGYSVMAVLHAGLAGLSAFGLKGALTPPPPGGFGGGFAFVGGVSANGSVAIPRLVWQAIELNPEFASWVYAQLFPAILSNLGNITLFAVSGGGYDVSGYSKQEHHFASNINNKYTPRFQKIADKYGLKLDDAWNKELLPQRGSHPTQYHEFVLTNMERAAREAGKSVEKFLELFEKYVKGPVRQNPGMLDKAWWGL